MEAPSNSESSKEPGKGNSSQTDDAMLQLDAEQVEALRHDIKNELNAVRMGVLLLNQLVSKPEALSPAALDKVTERMDRCLDQLNGLVDKRLRLP